MLVASNTSPISNLAVIGRLSLLRSQFQEIWIPGAVQSELHQLSDPAALKEIQQALQDGWIKPRVLREDHVARLLAADLDPGEAEAIALALELSADLILLDERDGRSAAWRQGLEPATLRGGCGLSAGNQPWNALPCGVSMRSSLYLPKWDASRPHSSLSPG